VSELLAAVTFPPPPLVPHRHVVVSVERETTDIVTIGLVPFSPAERLPVFAPGQFNMVYAYGIGEVALSMSSDPYDDAVGHTIRAVGAVTSRLCELAIGSVVGVRGPYGRGWGMGDLVGRDVVIVAGGIGLAPLRPAIYRLLTERQRYGELLLLAGFRAPSDQCFGAELDTWRGAGMQVEVTVDYAEPGWDGAVGLVTTLLPHGPFHPSRTTALVCGPEVMMVAVARNLVARGVDPHRIEVSIERNMKCAIAQCGHCQLGAAFVCRDGPVLDWAAAEPLLEVAER
jgi:anaerobic sulfite reductase subunit B